MKKLFATNIMLVIPPPLNQNPPTSCNGDIFPGPAASISRDIIEVRTDDDKDDVIIFIVDSSRVGDREIEEAASARFNNDYEDMMMYNDYEELESGGVGAEWSSYSPVGHHQYPHHRDDLGGKQRRGQSPDPHHNNPPSGSPFDDPFFNNFLKGIF